MTAYIIRRLGFSLFVLWGALTIVFAAIRLAPGDPAQLILGPDATADQLTALREKLGLNRPILVQYTQYLGQAVRLDFGASIRLDIPAAQAIEERLGETVRLALTAMLLGIGISFPLGIVAALSPRSAIDGIVSVASLLGQSVPSFWLGIMLILLFARTLRLLPSAGDDSWDSLIMPAITLALPLIGILTRLIRGGMLDVLDEDYIRTAQSKGLSPRAVIARHALVNMLIPVITVIGLQAGQLLGGAVIVETVFAWPGVGRLLVDAISNRDYPLVQAAVIFITLGFVIINFIVDLSYGWLDPRVRLG
jgi:ABC-type dipeptide/oligopeptide/nickel transport system permease component